MISCQLMRKRNIGMGDVNINGSGDVPDGENGGGMFSWYHRFARPDTMARGPYGSYEHG